MCVESAQVSTALIDDAPHRGVLQHQICGGQVGRSGHKGQYRSSECVRRISHDAEWPSGREEILQIALHHCGAIVHLLSQPPDAACVQLHRDHTGTGFDERQSERTGPGPKIDDQLARPNGRAGDNPLSPVRIQPVPAP
jgi:hypothetical protein